MSDERQKRWDERYVNLAREVATWSKDPSTKVGAVLVRPNNSVASTGFNGFPPGHDDSPELYGNRAYKYDHVVHAEVNALQFSEGAAKGATLYTSFPPCPACVSHAAASGVVRMVSPPINTEGRNREWVWEWEQNVRTSLKLAARYGIALEVLHV